MEKPNKSGGKAVATKVEGYTDDFGNRMFTVIERIGTLSDAGKVAGVTDEQIGRWRDGFSKPNFFGIARLAKAAGVSVSWLATGEGPLEDGASAAVKASTALPSSGADDFTLIRRLDVEASAGPGALPTLEQTLEFMAFQPAWLRSLGVNPTFARVITARGDSMEQTIRDRDILLVDTSVGEVRDNGIYCLVYGNMVLVKRIHVRLDGSIRLISDNPIYPPEEVSAADVEQLKIAGRVMWFGRSI